MRIWHPQTAQRLQVLRHEAEITSLVVGKMQDATTRTFAAMADGTAVMTLVKATTLAKHTWHADLAAALDSPNVFGVIAIAILLDLSAGLADFAEPDDTKDCFGRDNPINTIITLAVLSIFAIELLARMVAHGHFFWVPIKACGWNYFEVSSPPFFASVCPGPLVNDSDNQFVGLLLISK